MKIISKFKDYYDYMLEKYGIDNKIIFNRNIIKKTLSIKPSTLHCIYSMKPVCEYKILVICGKIYVIKIKIIYDKNKERLNNCVKNSDFSLLTREDLEDDKIFNEVSQMLQYIIKESDIKNKEKKKDLFYYKLMNGNFSPAMVDISIDINAPIFIINGWTNRNSSINIEEYVPKLMDIKGISGILPAETIFNDIAFFISNVLTNRKKDVSISNKDKIIKGGFDLKTSFRNM